MEGTKEYHCPGSYGTTRILKMKAVVSKQSGTLFRCYLVSYSHVEVKVQPYSEVHTNSFEWVVYKSDDTTIHTRYKFETEEEANQYFETTIADNVEQRYAKPLQED